jgi:hypothetical protein
MATVPTSGKPIVRQDFPAYMAKAMVLKFDENTENLKEEFNDFFHMETMTGAYDMELGMVGMGSPSLNTELEMPRYDMPSQGRPVIYTAYKYALGCKISFEAKEDDQFGTIVNSIMPQLAVSFRVERNQQAADIFNNAFTYMGYEPDGKSLVASDHPSLRYGSVRSNLLTLPLSIAGLQQATVRAQKYRTESGKIMPMTLKHLVVGPSQYPLALELTRSRQKPGQGFTTTPNDINTEYSQWQVHVLNYMEDDGRYFVIADKQFQHLKWKDRKKLYKKTIIDDRTECVEMIARARWALGFSDFSGIWGYNPS